MKTEEIKKAAREYTKSLEIGDCLMLQFGELEKYAKRDFVAGAKFANKIWQEKTRWIPVEERLPKMKKEPYYVLLKWEEANDEDIDVVYIFGQREIDYMLWVKCKYWKEIE